MTHSSKAQSADSKIANDTALVLTAAVLLFMGLLAPRVAAAEDGGTDKLASSSSKRRSTPTAGWTPGTTTPASATAWSASR